MTDAVMLFAAGFGTRMRHLTESQPKPLVKVGGVALIDHALEQVRAHGDMRCVVNAHYLATQIGDHFAGTSVAVSYEPDEILDTGGGLKAALPLLNSDTVFTMNTDAVWRGANGLDLLADAWQPDHMDALLLCVPTANAIGHRGQGDFTLAQDGHLTWGPGVVYTGLQILKTSCLDLVEEPVFSLKRIWQALEAKGRLHGVAYTGTWCDVGSPEGVALAEKVIGHV